MLEKDLIYFPRRNLLAPAIYNFFQPAGKKKVTICVQIPLISRPEPAVLETLFVSLRSVRILGHETQAPNHDLSNFPRRDKVALLIHNGNFTPAGKPTEAAFRARGGSGLMAI